MTAARTKSQCAAQRAQTGSKPTDPFDQPEGSGGACEVTCNDQQQLKLTLAKKRSRSQTTVPIVLFSCDGDFWPLVESLRRSGVRVSVVSTIRSQPPMISDDLRREVANFIELDNLKEVIGRPSRDAIVADGEETKSRNSHL